MEMNFTKYMHIVTGDLIDRTKINRHKNFSHKDLQHKKGGVLESYEMIQLRQTQRKV